MIHRRVLLLDHWLTERDALVDVHPVSFVVGGGVAIGSEPAVREFERVQPSRVSALEGVRGANLDVPQQGFLGKMKWDEGTVSFTVGGAHANAMYSCFWVAFADDGVSSEGSLDFTEQTDSGIWDTEGH